MADALVGIAFETTLSQQVLDAAMAPVAGLTLLDFYVALVSPAGVLVYLKQEGVAPTVTALPVTITEKPQGFYAPGFTPAAAGKYRLAVRLSAYGVSDALQIETSAAAAISATTLTDRPTVQAYLGSRAAVFSDAQIDLAVAWAGEAIKRHCGLNLEAADYRTWLTSSGSENLWLPEYPILAVRRAHADVGYCIVLSNAAAGALGFSVMVADGLLLLTIVGGASAGTETLGLAGYVTMADLAVAINGLATGWAAEVDTEGDPLDIRPMISSIENWNGTIYLLQPAGDCLAGIPDTKTGALVYDGGYWPRGLNGVFVNYRAGHETIPADLNGIATRLAADFLLAIGRDSGIGSEKLGNSQFTIRPGGHNLITNYKSELAPYRRLSA